MERREWRFALTISAAHGIDHFLKRIFPPLVPIWAVAFGFPLWKLGMILGARSFGSAFGQAPMGHLSDRVDRRIILPTGIALMGGSFIAFVALPHLLMRDLVLSLAGVSLNGQFVGMIIAMVFVGIGSSSLHPTGYPLISLNVNEDRKGKVLGMWGSARSFGDGAAPAFVGVALLVAGWKPIIVGFGLLGLAYACYLFFTLGAYETRPLSHFKPEEETTNHAYDLWRADRRRYIYPMIAVFAAFVLQITATTGVNVFLPQFITSEYSYSLSFAAITVTPASTASFYYSVLLLTAGVIQLGTGELVDRYDHRKVLVAFLSAGALVLSVFATSAFSPLVLFGVLILLGASLWGLNPARDAIVSDIAPPAHEGRTFGYLWTGTLLLASAVPAIVGYIGDVAGLRQAFAILAGIVFLSVIPVALLLSGHVYLEAQTEDLANCE